MRCPLPADELLSVASRVANGGRGQLISPGIPIGSWSMAIEKSPLWPGEVALARVSCGDPACQPGHALLARGDLQMAHGELARAIETARRLGNPPQLHAGQLRTPCDDLFPAGGPASSRMPAPTRPGALLLRAERLAIFLVRDSSPVCVEPTELKQYDA